jgi:hypothetical protein
LRDETYEQVDNLSSVATIFDCRSAWEIRTWLIKAKKSSTVAFLSLLSAMVAQGGGWLGGGAGARGLVVNCVSYRCKTKALITKMLEFVT